MAGQLRYVIGGYVRTRTGDVLLWHGILTTIS